MAIPAIDSIRICDVTDDHMTEIHDIYAHQVLHGISSWEEIPPTLCEMIERKNSIVSAGYPYRVALKGENLLGYAYASAYRARTGYRYTVENSIYVAETAHGQGIGIKLMNDLIERCETKGYKQMIAVIGDSANLPSINFHSKMGFVEAGILKSVGFKFGRWLDSVIMQRLLKER